MEPILHDTVKIFITETVVPDSLLGFSELLSYHKQEAAEGMSYLTTFLTLILAVVGYFGAIKKVSKTTRIIMSIVFVLFSMAILQSSLSSLEMHNAIHTEIQARLNASHYFLKNDMPNKMLEAKLPERWQFYVAFGFIDTCIVAAMLLIGRGKKEEERLNTLKCGTIITRKIKKG